MVRWIIQGPDFSRTICQLIFETCRSDISALRTNNYARAKETMVLRSEYCKSLSQPLPSNGWGRFFPTESSVRSVLIINETNVSKRI